MDLPPLSLGLTPGWRSAQAPELTPTRFAVASRPLRALTKIVAVSVLVLSLGLHWALLQTVAWTGMLIAYSRDGSFKQAVVKTFDGKHPCPLCRAIEQGRAEEKTPDKQPSNPVSKLDCGLVWQAIRFDFKCARERIPTLDAAAPVRADEPPKPRPRGILEGIAAPV